MEGMKSIRLAGYTWQRVTLGWMGVGDEQKHSPGLTCEDIPGLGIVMQDAVDHSNPGRSITVTHLPSGLSVGKHYSGVQKAAAFAASIAELADWTMPQDELLKCPALDAIVARIEAERNPVKVAPPNVVLPVGLVDGPALNEALKGVKDGATLEAPGYTVRVSERAGIQQSVSLPAKGERAVRYSHSPEGMTISTSADVVRKFLTAAKDAIVVARVEPPPVDRPMLGYTYTVKLMGYGHGGTGVTSLRMCSGLAVAS